MTQKEEKQKAIDDLELIEKSLIKKIDGVIKRKKPKRQSTYMKRCFEIFFLGIQLRQTAIQKYIVAAQPIKPNFAEGGIISESTDEFIITKDDKLIRTPKINL